MQNWSKMLSSGLLLSQLIVGAAASCGQGFMLINAHAQADCQSSVEEFSFSKSLSHANAFMDLRSFLFINDLTGASNAGLSTYDQANLQGYQYFIPHALLTPGDCWSSSGLWKSFSVSGLSARDGLPPIILELPGGTENNTAAGNQTGAWQRGDPPRNYYHVDVETGVITKSATPLAKRDGPQNPVGRRYTQGQVTLTLQNQGITGGRSFSLSRTPVLELSQDICKGWDGQDDATADVHDDAGNPVEMSWEPTGNANLNTVPANLLYSAAYEFAAYQGSRTGQGQAYIEIWNNEVTVQYGHLILGRV